MHIIKIFAKKSETIAQQSTRRVHCVVRLPPFPPYNRIICDLSEIKIQSLESWIKTYKGFAWGWENGKKW